MIIGRIMWCLAGLNMALDSLITALSGPEAVFMWVHPSVWFAAFCASAFAWLVFTFFAAQGQYE